MKNSIKTGRLVPKLTRENNSFEMLRVENFKPEVDIDKQDIEESMIINELTRKGYTKEYAQELSTVLTYKDACNMDELLQ